MSTLRGSTSYAAAAASAVDSDLLLDLKKLRVEDDNGGRIAVHQNHILTKSRSTNDKQVKPSTDLKIDLPDRTTGIDPSTHTPTKLSMDDDSDGSRTSFTSQAKLELNGIPTSEKDIGGTAAEHKPNFRRSILSILTGASSTQNAPEGCNLLASVGCEDAPPLSPILSTRPSRVSRFFPVPQAVSSDLESQEAKNVTADPSGPDSCGSSFVFDGLSGGLDSSTSDIRTLEQQTLLKRAKTSMAFQHGTVQGNEYILSEVWFPITDIPLAVPGNTPGPLQTPVAKVGQGQQPDTADDPIWSIHKPDGGFVTQQTNRASTAHNPRAAPFFPRGMTTIENLEQNVARYDEQRSLTVTRPQSTWDQVPNWRTRDSGKTRPCNGGPRKSGASFSGEAQRLREMYPQASSASRGGTTQDARQLYADPQSLSNSPGIPFPSSSQALSISQSSFSAHGAVSKRGTSRTFELFRPMKAVLNPDAHKQPLSEEDIAFREKNGISLNYLGNHENPRNISANIPDKENCSIWITNLPKNCTHKDLLKALIYHRPGRVWATHVSAPDQPKFEYAAAKVVFYHPIEAQRLLQLARWPGIFVRGRRIQAIYNKQRVPVQEYGYPTSRVLEIRGDKAIVNEKFLRSLFTSHFKFEDEAVEVLAEFSDICVIEWRFGSMRAQASSAYKLLERMYPCVDVRYATDPCAQYLTMATENQRKQLVAPVQDRHH